MECGCRKIGPLLCPMVGNWFILNVTWPNLRMLWSMLQNYWHQLFLSCVVNKLQHHILIINKRSNLTGQLDLSSFRSHFLEKTQLVPIILIFIWIGQKIVIADHTQQLGDPNSYIQGAYSFSLCWFYFYFLKKKKRKRNYN